MFSVSATSFGTRACGPSIALAVQPVGKQLKLADARTARFAILIGPDDRASGQVALKDLSGKEQVAVAAGDAVAELKRRLHP